MFFQAFSVSTAFLKTNLKRLNILCAFWDMGSGLVKLLLMPFGKTHSGGSLENCHLV